MRSFADMAARHAALEAFHGGTTWQQHRDRANATIVDSDNVRLLRPLGPGPHLPAARPPLAPAASHAGLVIATTCTPSGNVGAFTSLFAREITPALERAGGTVLAMFATDSSPNTYPRLKVHTDAAVVVCLLGFAPDDDHATHLAVLADAPGWRDVAAPLLASCLRGPPDWLVANRRLRRRHAAARTGIRFPRPTGFGPCWTAWRTWTSSTARRAASRA
jgi:hypothetical protein